VKTKGSFPRDAVPNAQPESKRLWVVSELFYPEQSATGYYMTRIAEGLAGELDVRVLCGQPTYSARGVRAPVDEVRNSVQIHRCSSTTLDKNSLLRRSINLLTLSIAVVVQALIRFRRGDRVLVVTNPPSLPFLISLACKWRGAECLLLIHDVFPDALVATGILKPRSFLVSILRWLNRLLYGSVEHIVVIGRDMSELLRQRIPSNPGPSISVIPNWADVDLIVPRPRDSNHFLRQWKSEEKFVIQSSGNLARSAAIETMVAAAELLKSDNGVHFVFVGSGVKKEWLERTVSERRLASVDVLPPQPRDMLCELLNASDVALLGLVRGMKGVSVPSRLYNILAAGKPVLALAEPESEVARVVQEESIGWVVDPADPGMLVDAIAEARSSPDNLRRMGERARAAAEKKYRYSNSLELFRSLLAERTGGGRV
jgi:colanic acid biosynthesis glycosyl transferase WcaI